MLRRFSSSDAIGLMQIKWPLTAEHLGILNKQQLFEPCTNIGAGSKYLRELLNRFEYEMAALAAYHFGPTAVTKTKAVPIETLNYIQKVLDEKNYILKSRNFNKAVVCNPLDLRANASETHDPLERRDLALDWIEETALVCSISELVLIRNHLSAWFGTSNSDGKIGRALDSVIISKSSDPLKSKGRGCPRPFPTSILDRRSILLKELEDQLWSCVGLGQHRCTNLLQHLSLS